MSHPFGPPPSDPEMPVLTPDVAADDEALAEAVDAFINNDSVARAQLVEIADFQEALRGAVHADVWGIVLRLDELTTARWADLAVAIARWAFDAGRLFPLAGNGEGAS
jgi:hypothetical protein